MTDSQSLLVLDVEGLTPQENEVVSLIAAGMGYKPACAKAGMTTYRYQQLRINKPAFDQAASRARTLSIDLEVDEMREIVETTDDQQKAKNLVDVIKWRASKLKASVYGDKLQVDHQVTVNIGEALANARARIARPSCDPVPAIDAEYVDVSNAYTHSATDSASQAPSSVKPDIFS